MRDSILIKDGHGNTIGSAGNLYIHNDDSSAAGSMIGTADFTIAWPPRDFYPAWTEFPERTVCEEFTIDFSERSKEMDNKTKRYSIVYVLVIEKSIQKVIYEARYTVQKCDKDQAVLLKLMRDTMCPDIIKDSLADEGQDTYVVLTREFGSFFVGGDE